MTKKRRLKARIRARMSETGETYTAARAALLASRHQTSPPRARHDQTFVLHRLLAERHGVAIREADWLGLGGGIGAQLFIFEYEGHAPSVYIGTRAAHQYAYDAAFCERALTALGAEVRLRETGSARKASTQLDETLLDGPVMAWVGLEALHGRSAESGATPWVVLVHEAVEDAGSRRYAIEDADAGPMSIDAERLATARAAVRKAKHRLLIPGAPTRNVAEAWTSGVHWCIAELRGEHALKGYARNFGLGALQKWRDDLASTRKTGWARRFATPAERLAVAEQLYGWVQLATGGSAFRSMYGEFLENIPSPSADGAASCARRCASTWHGLSERLLDPEVPALAAARERLHAGPWPRALTRPQPGPDGLEAWSDQVFERLHEDVTQVLDEERALLAALQGLTTVDS